MRRRRRSIPRRRKTGGPAPPPTTPPVEGACSPAWRRRATANGAAGRGSPGTADGLLLRSVSVAVVAEGLRRRSLDIYGGWGLALDGGLPADRPVRRGGWCPD